MTIDRDGLYGDKNKARAFLTSRNGVILHEVAHYVAANTTMVIGGHLIIEADTSRGAFCVHRRYRHRLTGNVQLAALMIAAGALAELHYTDQTGVHRLPSDIQRYRDLYPRLSHLRDQDVVRIWRRDHRKEFIKLTECIERNYDRCVELCDRGTFFYDRCWIIPTCELDPPVTRSRADYAEEVILTAHPVELKTAEAEYFDDIE